EAELGEADEALLQIEKALALSKRQRAKEAMGALEVRAPHDGIVVHLRDWMGHTVQPGNTTHSGHPIAELPALDRMEAVVYVLEADGGGLKEEARGEVTIEGRGGRIFPATVRSVDRMPKPRLRGQPLQYFEATLTLDETIPELMKPGRRVRAKLTLDELEAALVVPRQAVFEDRGQSYVHRLRDGVFERVEVALGPASLGRIVIESGLTEGDVIAARDPGRSRGEIVESPKAALPLGSMR
ncbi:MAG: efflux RND transporter periplasmic adaptor subunit, partial [Vicinamibacteria bacterium]